MAFRKLFASFADKHLEDLWHELNRRIEQAVAAGGGGDAIYCGVEKTATSDSTPYAMNGAFLESAVGDMPFLAPRAGTLSNLQVRLGLSPTPGTITATVYVNGAPTALSVTLTNGQIYAIDAANTVAVAQADRIELVQTSSVFAGTYGRISCVIGYA